MLSKKQAELVAIKMVYESKLSRPSKLQLIKFIEESTINQLHHFILKQEIVKDSQVNVNEFFRAAALVALATAAGKIAYDKIFTSAPEECKQFTGDPQKQCINNYKIRGYNEKIAALRKQSSQCNQTFKPDKCNKMFLDHIKKNEDQIRKLRYNV